MAVLCLMPRRSRRRVGSRPRRATKTSPPTAGSMSPSPSSSAASADETIASDKTAPPPFPPPLPRRVRVRGSPRLLAPDKGHDAGRTAVLRSEGAARIDLAVYAHGVGVVHRHDALRIDRALPAGAPGLADDTVSDRDWSGHAARRAFGARTAPGFQ